MIKLNCGTVIKEDDGDYAVLVDYHEEGLAVHAQSHSLEDAIRSFHGVTHGPAVLVKVVSIDINEKEKFVES